MNLTDKAKEFTNAVKQTVEYIELKQAHTLIEKNPSLKKKMDELVRRQQELMTNYRPGQQEINAKTLEVNEEFKRLSVIPEVKKYLTAGNNFNNMISKVFKTIHDSIERDLKTI